MTVEEESSTKKRPFQQKETAVFGEYASFQSKASPR